MLWYFVLECFAAASRLISLSHESPALIAFISLESGFLPLGSSRVESFSRMQHDLVAQVHTHMCHGALQRCYSCDRKLNFSPWSRIELLIVFGSFFSVINATCEKKAEETWKCKFYGEFARSSTWNRKLDVRSRAQCTLSPAGEPKSRRNQIKSSSSSSVESGEKNYHQHDFTASDADDDDVDWIFGSEIFREMISGERMANEIIETTTC